MFEKLPPGHGSEPIMLAHLTARMPSLSREGTVALPGLGFMCVTRRPSPSAAEVEAARLGPWSIGLLRGGAHGTCIHLRFGAPGSAQGGDPLHYADFLIGMVGPGSLNLGLGNERGVLPITFVLADDADNALACRQVDLSGEGVAFLSAEMERQNRAFHYWSREAQVRSYVRAMNRHGDLIPRRACSVWIDVQPLPQDEAG